MRAQELSPTARAAEHFVKDQKDAMTGADIADTFKIFFRRDYTTGGEPTNRLNSEGNWTLPIPGWPSMVQT